MKSLKRFVSVLQTAALIATFAVVPTSHAKFTPRAEKGKTEEAEVVRFDLTYNDTIVRLNSGEEYLVQHSPRCRTLSLERPVKIVWNEKDEITHMKVAYNERCIVHSFTPYTSLGTLVNRFLPKNRLLRTKDALVIWDGVQYMIEFGYGCNQMRKYLGKTIYFHLPNGTLEGGRLYLPDHHGNCSIDSAEMIGIEPTQIKAKTIKGIMTKAENGEAYLYWDPVAQKDADTVYIISYSKKFIDPAEYHWREMPNLNFSKKNEITLDRLKDYTKYYVYIASLDLAGYANDWSIVTVTPEVKTDLRFVDKSEKDDFAIELVNETSGYYEFAWPEKENAKSYRVSLFLDNRLKAAKIQKGNVYRVPKTEEFVDKHLKLRVYTIRERRNGKYYKDSYFWVHKDAVSQK